jgi:hypothetical protein
MAASAEHERSSSSAAYAVLLLFLAVIDDALAAGINKAYAAIRASSDEVMIAHS